MKYCILIISMLFIGYASNAQNEVDALRYSNLNPFGTARFTALGGAMGALGGDVTTMAFNPAGIGVYRSNVLVFTPSWTSTSIESNYRGSGQNARSVNKIQLTNIGFVSANENNGEQGFEFVNFGFSYNQLANYNYTYYVAGQNNLSSFLDPETKYLESVDYVNDLSLYNIFYETNLVDYQGGEYVNPYNSIGYGSFQTKQVQSSGYAGEYNLNISTNFSDIIYAGLSLGIMHVTYREKYYYTETPDNNSDLKVFNVDNQFVTRGNGLNLKVGIIARPNKWVRLGAAVHTPTLLNLSDDYSQSVYANFVVPKDGLDYDVYNSKDFEYQLSTPYKAIFSAAFIYKNLGFISIDYEYQDYSAMNYQSEGYDFIYENNQITALYKPASNIKIGGEYKFGPLATRLGFAYHQSPYDSEYKNEIADTYVYSGGIGLRSNEMFVDFTTRYVLRNEYVYLYNSPDDAFADISFKQISYLISIGFKF